MKLARRTFLKFSGLAAGSSLLFGPENAFAYSAEKNTKQTSMLIDTTRCIGCQACERACSERNSLIAPVGEPSVSTARVTDDAHYTVVNAFQTDKGTVFCKTQCMHCDQPACVSACLVNAMYKTKEGPVIWKEDKCMGCRYCMLACPFDVPKFEYGSINPRVMKCIFCYKQLVNGTKPACVQACPQEAIQMGRRDVLLAAARKRIYDNPNQYIEHIYGETEVGGTNMLYLSGVPFEQLGFKTDLGTIPYPEHTKTFLYSVPLVLLLGPTFMAGIRWSTRDRGEGSHH